MPVSPDKPAGDDTIPSIPQPQPDDADDGEGDRPDSAVR